MACAGGGDSVPVLTILVMTTWMSAMAGFGALPYFFTGAPRIMVLLLLQQ